jgi:membrane protein
MRPEPRTVVTTTAGLARDLRREWRDDRVGGLAAEVAFFGILSVFPALLALAALLGRLELILGGDVADRAEHAVLDALERVLTEEASGTTDAIASLFDQASPGLFTFSTIAAVWATSRGLLAVVNALDVAYDVPERRSFVHQRALALGLATLTVLAGALVLAMLVVGPLLGGAAELAERAGWGPTFASTWRWLRWPVVLVALTGWATVVFHVGPNVRMRWRHALPGAALTALWCAVVSLGLQLYLSVATTGANPVFGALGGALIALVWLYTMSLGLLVGGELNAVLARRARAGWSSPATGDDPPCSAPPIS